MMRSMGVEMNDKRLQTLAQIQAFLEGTVAVDFVLAAEERYGFIARTLRRFGYARLASEACRQGRGAAFSEVDQRLCAPTTHPAGQTVL